MKQVQFISTDPTALAELITDAVKLQIEELKKEFTPKQPPTYLTRKETAKLLHVDLSTLFNWQKRNILIPKGIGNRVLYDRKDIEKKLIELKR